MATEDLLRSAREAEHDGRPALREALLTLAVAESGPSDPWADRCRARLISERPDHFLGKFTTIGEALGDPRVVASMDRLRARFPPMRVAWLLFGARATRGAYTGRTESLGAMIEDLAETHAGVENIRLDSPQAARGPLARHRSARLAKFTLSYSPDESPQGRESRRGPESSPLRRKIDGCQ